MDHMSSLKAAINQYNERSGTQIKPIHLSFRDKEENDKEKNTDKETGDTKTKTLICGLKRCKAVHENLVHANSKYKQDADHKRRHVDFEEGDFVWAVLTKDRFPVGEYNKLSAKKIGPLEIVEKINSNAYRLKLPSHVRCSDVFNVKHLIHYHGDSSDDDLAMNSRTNFVYPGGNEGGPSIEERADLFLEAQDRVKKRASVKQP
ncbi:hypothetical protein Tco_0168938 [Tanacetum coccineum]